MTTPTHKELREIAERASKNWYGSTHCFDYEGWRALGPSLKDLRPGSEAKNQAHFDAEFINELSPQVALELLAQLSAARNALEEIANLGQTLGKDLERLK